MYNIKFYSNTIRQSILPAVIPDLSVSKSFFMPINIHARPPQTSKQATSSKNTSMDVHVEHKPEPLLQIQTMLPLHHSLIIIQPPTFPDKYVYNNMYFSFNDCSCWGIGDQEDKN